MARKLVSQLKPGMVLSRDLLDDRGRLLLPARTALTPQHLRILKQRSLSIIHVAGEEEDALKWKQVDLSLLSTEEHIQCEKETNDLFRNTDRESPFVSLLYYYILDRRNRLRVLGKDSDEER